jgi:hypothetical protein
MQMEELLNRIYSASPDPIRLTKDEYAKLSAYVKTHRPKPSMSAMQRARRGDKAEQAKLDEQDSKWKALNCTLEYNRELAGENKKAESEYNKAASVYKSLCQEDMLLLQATAKKVAILVDKPENMDYFRKQLTEFADKWTVYETATEAERKGEWQASMGIPSNPL